VNRVVEQSGFSDPGLAAEDQHAALGLPHGGEESLEHFALLVAADQRRSWPSIPTSKPMLGKLSRAY